MDESVPALDPRDADPSGPTATYMPSLGARAPIFVKSSSAFEYAAYYRSAAAAEVSGRASSKPSPVNPPVTPWDDSEDGRYGGCLSPVNMLLATDLSEVMVGVNCQDGRGERRAADTAAVRAAGMRWPYLKQQAARHVYGNLRARLQNRDSVATPSTARTPHPTEDDLKQPLDGMHIQSFGIRPKGDHSSDSSASLKDPTQLPVVSKEVRPFEEKKNYRISFKQSRDDARGCVSAPPPTAESTVSSKVNSSEAAPSSKAGLQVQQRRSKTAREHYRPKRDPLVKFDARELPARLQQDRQSVPATAPFPRVPSKVTWTDVITAKSDGVYRDSPAGLGGRSCPNNGSNGRLYLSSELWGILDEDIGALKTVSGNS